MKCSDITPTKTQKAYDSCRLGVAEMREKISKKCMANERDFTITITAGVSSSLRGVLGGSVGGEISFHNNSKQDCLVQVEMHMGIIDARCKLNQSIDNDDYAEGNCKR